MIDFKKLKQLYNFGKDLTISDIQTILKSSKVRLFAAEEFLVIEGQKRKEVLVSKFIF